MREGEGETAEKLVPKETDRLSKKPETKNVKKPEL